MAKYFVMIFLGMFVYGVIAGMYGAALLALLMVPFTVYGHYQLRKRDIEFYTHPRSATQQASTEDMLVKHNCEAS